KSSRPPPLSVCDAVRKVAGGRAAHDRFRDFLGVAEFRRALAARDHRHRLDRLVLLLRRARSWPAPAARPARRRVRRGMAGAWRWLLPHPEVSGGAGRDARTPYLVQMGIVRDLDVGLRDALRRL